MTNTSTDLAMLSATELTRLYASKEISPVDVAKACLGRISAHDHAVNAFCLVDEETTLKSATESESRWARGEPCGQVDGIPTTIKDLQLTKGWPTLRGSKSTNPDGPWDEDSPAVARLKENGAVLLGKTTTPEFGWKGVTDNPLTGITRNPWNTGRTPGGSSGGAAVAAALGMGALHIGTDGGGSIRIPASFTGIFGHKPSFGRVPAAPLSPFGTVSHIGPMTRTVADSALMLNVLAEPDARDWFSLPYDNADYLDGLGDGIKGMKIAYSPTLGYAEVDADVARAVDEAVQVFSDLGAHVEAVDPGFDDPYEIFEAHWYAGAANLLRDFTDEQLAMIDPGLREIAEDGLKYSLMDYMAAVNARGQLGQHMRLFHEKWDLLITPTLATSAFEAGKEIRDGVDKKRWMEWTPFSIPFNLTQQPACSVPCGFSDDGMPVGLHIVGPMHDDRMVLRAAAAFEAVRPFPMPDMP
ncbi:MAG: amidase [Rhodospirillales bacterium]|jgi:aspartyl-tRNA(Asn)/glutamyl-tRNA(Gln) amidotransferase subunit A|nr:amidase [Rhodospirillales bacterium]MBT4626420.1 amidase [Rhodospirillales bacterium]MBT5350897.1 amidase [Rhodospirillales bacterium]MBT5520664.1 amidase [Rhodospirillales bacterium]MBT6109073.1 amidase [Rhodospirillales bacterium]